LVLKAVTRPLPRAPLPPYTSAVCAIVVVVVVVADASLTHLRVK